MKRETIVLHKYKVILDKEVFVLTFKAGTLASIEFETDISSGDTMPFFEAISSGREDEIINRLRSIAKVRNIKIPAVNQKIALWCELYKMNYGIDYKVTAADAGRVKNIEMSKDLIVSFFNSTEWYAKEKTISRYTSNYNDIKRKAITGTGNQKTHGSINDLAEAFSRRYSS